MSSGKLSCVKSAQIERFRHALVDQKSGEAPDGEIATHGFHKGRY